MESTSDNIARIVLRLDLGTRRKEIKFPFDLESDTAEAVAAEMVKELRLQDSARVQLADGIFDSSKPNFIVGSYVFPMLLTSCRNSS